MAVWGHTLRHSVLFTCNCRTAQHHRPALLCEERKRTRWLFSPFDYQRDPAPFGGLNSDDRRPAFGSILDGSHGVRLESSSAGCADALLVMDRALDGPGISKQI